MVENAPIEDAMNGSFKDGRESFHWGGESDMGIDELMVLVS